MYLGTTRSSCEQLFIEVKLPRRRGRLILAHDEPRDQGASCTLLRTVVQRSKAVLIGLVFPYMTSIAIRIEGSIPIP